MQNKTRNKTHLALENVAVPDAARDLEWQRLCKQGEDPLFSPQPQPEDANQTNPLPHTHILRPPQHDPHLVEKHVHRDVVLGKDVVCGRQELLDQSGQDRLLPKEKGLVKSHHKRTHVVDPPTHLVASNLLQIQLEKAHVAATVEQIAQSLIWVWEVREISHE